MEIKYKTTLFLQKVHWKSEAYNEAQIRIAIRYYGNEIFFNVGYTIDPKNWDKSTGRVKKNVTNKKKSSSREINAEIQRIENIIFEVIRAFEIEERIPSKQDFKNEFNISIGKSSGNRRRLYLPDLFQKYMIERSKNKSWAVATIIKHRVIKGILEQFSDKWNSEDISPNRLNEYHAYLLKRGMQNTSIKRHLSFLKSFFSWANLNDYISNKEWKKFSPEVKTIRNKSVVFLTWNELIKLYEFEFPSNKAYLDRTRDVFCFCCFTSIRYSDVAKLKRTDIFEDHIRVVTEKTDQELSIDLNERAKKIVLKYKDQEFKDNLALPVFSNQKMNSFIKECCFIIGLNDPVTTTYYKGNERIDEVKPKYEMISTHSARRTFICNALILGIAPEIVMKWTGHSDYKQMQPYIDIASEEKKKAMRLFDR